MILAFSARNRLGEEQHFTCLLDNLETSLNAVILLVEQGHQLLKVELIELDHRRSLPLEAFDGQPLSAALQQLEAQYQSILNRPIQCTDRPRILRLCRINWYNSMIHRLEQVIAQAEQRLNRVKQSLPDKPHVRPTVEQLERTLKRYEANLLAEQASLMNLPYRL